MASAGSRFKFDQTAIDASLQAVWATQREERLKQKLVALSRDILYGSQDLAFFKFCHHVKTTPFRQSTARGVRVPLTLRDACELDFDAALNLLTLPQKQEWLISKLMDTFDVATVAKQVIAYHEEVSENSPITIRGIVDIDGTVATEKLQVGQASTQKFYTYEVIDPPGSEFIIAEWDPLKSFTEKDILEKALCLADAYFNPAVPEPRMQLTTITNLTKLPFLRTLIPMEVGAVHAVSSVVTSDKARFIFSLWTTSLKVVKFSIGADWTVGTDPTKAFYHVININTYYTADELEIFKTRLIACTSVNDFFQEVRTRVAGMEPFTCSADAGNLSPDYTVRDIAYTIFQLLVRDDLPFTITPVYKKLLFKSSFVDRSCRPTVYDT